MISGRDGVLDEIEQMLLGGLHLSKNATIQKDVPVVFNEIGFLPDYIFKDGEQIIIVEIKNTPSQIDLSMLAFIKMILGNKEPNYRYVIAGKNISSRISELANRIGVETFQLPYSLAIESVRDDRGKITAEKAWVIITEILTQDMPSIRSIAIKTEVSYGWAHRVVNRLVARGIATRHADFIRITDYTKLLNMVALERPMIQKQIGIIQTGFQDTHDAGTAITRSLDSSKINFTFTGYTAANLYTGYGTRHDSVDLYVEGREELFGLKQFEEKILGRIKIYVYQNDRDVFSNSRHFKNIKVVSKPQALMDIAGFGMSARDIAYDMVKRYGTIQSY
jgi:hypothetical protein